MCRYPFTYYCCGHDSVIWSDTIEYCADRSVSAHSIDIWTTDMCSSKVVTCLGMTSYVCHECSEDYTLEFELDE
ncbi:hypothetical protein EJ03DRAFT_318879 [Teratosphaeria nubilosa]|uniref:Uncharacterized protein n=1 Tax=Teratosphaeria nubilosa TaxID=161662 RepID=A0A6G1KZH7_9PEZI|nr:hypothetical protein EJ03DRAFT_318879 [Teratosphaeria nubilosa]